ncbi:MAG: KH domain-containing protein [Firmicutes bacterium]|nr:KH domain-containing protein [Bacillota bacterium]
MQDLLDVVAKALVNNPAAVEVNKVERDSSVVLELKVAPEDMGKVIGKQGRIARAIRTVIRAAAAKDSRRVMVEIVEHS